MSERAAAKPRWREDFPVRWDEDNYMTRRELAKFLTLGSGCSRRERVIAFIGLTQGLQPRCQRSPASTTCRAADPCSSGIRRPRTRASSCAVRQALMPSRGSARICHAPSCTGRMIARSRVRATRAGFPLSMANHWPARRRGGCLVW